MTHALSQLKPTIVWDYFYQLTQIPRPSKHEEKIQAFMLDFGQSLGLDTFRDDIGNIIIKKPATTGYEDRKTVVLQSHLDMVPQANNDTPHDFTSDPINAYIDSDTEGDWVTAKGTTLGADNGMGVAAIMAVLADNTIEHGALEALFTCDEETGMTGAFGLKNDSLDGEILLNLDTEDEKELYVGCAGGVDGTFTLPIERQNTPTDKKCYRIDLTGLKGGHSGVDIHLQRANANKLLARFLMFLNPLGDWQLNTFNGGNLRNAIPRESHAIIVLSDSQYQQLPQYTAQFKAIIEREYGDLEPSISLSISDNQCDSVLTKSSQDKLLRLLNACPNGVYRMSIDVENLVETSSNLSIVTTTHDNLVVECLLRSSVDSARDDLAAQLESLFQLAGASSQYTGAYPGWQPNPNSEILSIMKQTGKDSFGEEPKIRAIHAGLECGLLGGIYPHWDMISFGPTIKFPHSPDEKVHINSVAVFYDWLLVTLKAIPKR